MRPSGHWSLSDVATPGDHLLLAMMAGSGHWSLSDVATPRDHLLLPAGLSMSVGIGNLWAMEENLAEPSFELPQIWVGFHLGVLANDLSLPDTQCGGATVDLSRDGDVQRVVHAGFSWRPIHDHERDDNGSAEVDWVLELDVPRVHPQYLGMRLGLRLVGAVMAHFSAGRRVRVTVVAEPWSWQSLKASHREAQLPAIARHWGRLGFRRDPWAISTYGNTVTRIAHDFRVPAQLATWGPYAASGSYTAFAENS
jgi:hypothetical protein